jgi:hypothetical protein
LVNFSIGKLEGGRRITKSRQHTKTLLAKDYDSSQISKLANQRLTNDEPTGRFRERRLKGK